MELRVLRYFLAVAREESISRAAESLHITQPTLSRQLMDLEAELGTQLFIRSRRDKSIRLTEDGIRLRSRAEEILTLADKTAAEFSASEDSVSGEIAIGAGETDAVRLLAETAERIHEQHPGIRFHLFSGNAETVTDRLDKGLIDFGVLVGSVDMAKYNSLSLPAQDTWGVLMRTDSELAPHDRITPELLRDKPLLLSQQSLAHNEFSGWLGLEAEQLDVVATYNLIYNATLFVEAGMGYAVTIDKLVNTQGRELVFRPLSPKMESRLSLVWKKYHVFAPAAELFLRGLREAVL